MCRSEWCEDARRFVLRSLFVANFSTLLFLIFVTILVISYIILLCERPYPKADDLTEFASCLWLTLITMTTVGYGDVVPLTKIGRFVSAINACIGVVFLSLVIQGGRRARQDVVEGAARRQLHAGERRAPRGPLRSCSGHRQGLPAVPGELRCLAEGAGDS